MRIRMELTGRATYNLREVLAEYGFEWDGRSWYGNILSEDLEKSIKMLKDVGIICYHGDFSNPIGCKLLVYPTNMEDYTEKEFKKVMDCVKKMCVGEYLSKDDHFTMRRFYEGYGDWDEIEPILASRR